MRLSVENNADFWNIILMMKRIVFKITLFIALSFFVKPIDTKANYFHPFFVSVTELNFNSKNNSLEVSCKMFLDDLQNGLSKLYKRTIDLNNAKAEAENNKILADYVTKHFSIATDAKATALKFVGFEVEKESVYCYFEAGNIAQPKKVQLNNEILIDFKPEQINIMHVMVNGNRKSTKTDTKTTQATVTF